MHLDSIEIVVLVIALIAFVTYRQSRWQIFDLTRLFRSPILFLVIGVVTTASTLSGRGGVGHVGALDVVIIGVELVLGLAAGLLMGRTTESRTVDGVTSFRLRPVGLGIWIGFIAVRIGLGVVAHLLGASFAAQPIAIFFVLAVVKGVQAVMVRTQIERQAEHRTVYAGTGF